MFGVQLGRLVRMGEPSGPTSQVEVAQARVNFAEDPESPKQ